MALSIPYGNKNSYSSMRDVKDLIESLKIPNIHIMFSPMTDDLTIVNSLSHTRHVVTRYALEDSADPIVVLREALCKVMAVPIDKLGDIIKSAQLPQYDYNPDGTIVATDGTIVARPGPGDWYAGGAIGAAPIPPRSPTGYFTPSFDRIPMEDEKIKQLKARLFSEAEREELRQVKQKIRNYYIKYRTTEEMIYLFNTAQLVIAGGCFASMLNGEDVKDYDVFLLDYKPNREVAKMMAAKYDISDFSTEDIANRRVKVGNTNYMDNEDIEHTIFFQDSRVQYIVTKYKTREELVQHFDFKHCCVSYDLSNDNLFITRQVYDLIKSKTLVPNGMNRTPEAWRYQKFLDRGWKKPEIMLF